jgi:hypothetical protein
VSLFVSSSPDGSAERGVCGSPPISPLAVFGSRLRGDTTPGSRSSGSSSVAFVHPVVHAPVRSKATIATREARAMRRFLPTRPYTARATAQVLAQA